MIPGLLALKNCKKYSLRIYPDTFPANQIGDRIGKKWTQGNVTDFTYIVPTNTIDLENDIEFNLDDISLSLKWNEPFTCDPLDLKIIQKPYLHKNHSHHEVIISESNDYQTGTYMNFPYMKIQVMENFKGGIFLEGSFPI